MNHDVVVVGGGYWGTAIAKVCDARGVSCALIDDRREEGASRAASGHMSLGWYKGEWKSRADRAYALARAHRAPFVRTGAWVTGVDGKAKRKEDWFTLDPEQMLGMRAPDVIGRVVSIAIDHERWSVGTDRGNSGRPIIARRLLVAAGVWTDDVLRLAGLQRFATGVAGLPGAGLIFEGPEIKVPRVYKTNPYHGWTMREWGSDPADPSIRLVRFGDTQERTPGKDYVGQLRAAAEERLGAGCVLRHVVRGVRPILKGGPIAEPLANTLPPAFVATGGGRTGALLAWWAAERALEWLNNG